MPVYSQLIYYGGEKMMLVISAVCRTHGIHDHYVEPYAGGSIIGLNLPFVEQVREITINYLDRSIYAFNQFPNRCVKEA